MNYVIKHDIKLSSSWLRWVLVDPEEENGVCLFVVDEEEERMVRLELGVEQRPSRAEPEESSGCRGFTSFLIDFNERFVLGGVEADGVLLATVLVQEPGQVGVPAEQLAHIQFLQRLEELQRAGNGELW